MDFPICAKCGKKLTPGTARRHPEYFLHDDCLPEELLSPVKPATRLWELSLELEADVEAGPAQILAVISAAVFESQGWRVTGKSTLKPLDKP